MSKNFELLRKLGKDQELLGSTPTPGDPAVPAESSPASWAAPAAETFPSELPQNLPGLEEINHIVQQVFVGPGTEAPRVALFASPESGGGSTWVCAHVGEVLAQRTAGNVCLVDANFRRPELERHFEVRGGAGLAEALAQTDPVGNYVQGLGRPNMFLLNSGAVPDGGAAAITSDRMRLRIAELRSTFDFVLLDVGAMDACGDALALGPFCDGVVLVLKAHASKRQNARKAVQHLQSAGAKVLGAVLNQRTYPIPDVIYKRL